LFKDQVMAIARKRRALAAVANSPPAKPPAPALSEEERERVLAAFRQRRAAEAPSEGARGPVAAKASPLSRGQLAAAYRQAPPLSPELAAANRARAAQIEAAEAGSAGQSQPQQRDDLRCHNDNNARVGPRAG
jgi:hypothetical protein